MLILLLMFFMRPEHGPDFLAKVTVDIEVDGEPVLIERIVECRTFEVPAGDLFQRLWRRAPTRYFPVVRGMGARLKSGGAIMMYTPYLCDHQVEGTWPFRTIKVTPNPPGALTMMAWTKDADDPEELEIYASQAYFDHPDARVKINRIEATDPPPGATADPPGEFSWFAQEDVYYKRPKHRGVATTLSNRAIRSPKSPYTNWRAYRTLSVTALAQEIWSQDRDLAALLRGVTQPVVLEGDRRRAASDFIRRNYVEAGLAYGHRGTAEWLPPKSAGEEPTNVAARQIPHLDKRVHPLRVKNGRARLEHLDGAPHLLGIAYPQGDMADGNDATLVRGDVEMGVVRLDGPLFDLAFDPASQTLLVVWPYRFKFEGRPD